jgi:hypothetical protein
LQIHVSRFPFIVPFLCVWIRISSLVTLVKSHIRNYLDGIFELIHQYWGDVALLPQVRQR